MPPTKRVRKPSSRMVPVPPTVAKRKQKRQTPKEVATPGIEATNTQGCSGRETQPDHEVGRAMDQTSGCIGDVSTGDTGAGSSGTASAGVLPTGGECIDIPFNPHDHSVTLTPSVPSALDKSSQSVAFSAFPSNQMFSPFDMSTSGNVLPELTQCGVDDLGSNLPISLKEKIWKGEFINLTLMLKSDRDLQEYACTAAVFVNSGGHLELKPKSIGKRVETIAEWTSAFTIFTSIYIQAHSEAIQGMLKYMSTIRMAAGRHPGFGWRAYDEQFRLRQARNPSNSWGSINVELWMLYMQGQTHQQQFPVQQSFQRHTGNADSAIPVQDAEALITQPEAADQQKSPDLLTLGWTPVKQDVLREIAEQYPNQETAQELVKGFKEGFSLNYNGPRIPLTANNLKSVKVNLNIAKTKIGKEVALGRVAGPFDNPPMSHFRISPIGLVPKSTEGDFRVIHHLSYPEGESVNDYIDLAPVHYASFDKAVDMIHNFGKGALLAKADIKSAFRLMIVSPSDFDLLGFSLDGKFYFDKCLPMGCSISCSLFEKFSTFIEWAVKEREKSGDTMHYLDDFLFCGKPASDHCSRALKTFCDVCTELGVPIAGEKTVYPTTKLVFLGLELDSDTMSIRIPEDKVQKAMENIGNMINSTKVRLFEMQALVGYLNFLCKALPPGRTFLRRLINSMMGKKKHHRIRVNRDIKADLRTWMVFLTHFNGTAIMRQRWWETNDKLQFFTDSAGGQTLGFGIFFQNSWACETWPSAWMEEGLTKNITLLEYFPIVVALEIWGKQLKNKKVLFQSGNQAVVQIINSMTSKCDQVMTLVRHMVLLCLEMNITVRGQYIKGKSNEIADSLSRFQMAKFHTLAPQADAEATPVPVRVWEILVPRRNV